MAAAKPAGAAGAGADAPLSLTATPQHDAWLYREPLLLPRSSNGGPWEPDCDDARCRQPGCRAVMEVGQRHHCRKCGLLFCERHSRFRSHVEGIGHARTCYGCHIDDYAIEPLTGSVAIMPVPGEEVIEAASDALRFDVTLRVHKARLLGRDSKRVHVHCLWGARALGAAAERETGGRAERPSGSASERGSGGSGVGERAHSGGSSSSGSAAAASAAAAAAATPPLVDPRDASLCFNTASAPITVASASGIAHAAAAAHNGAGVAPTVRWRTVRHFGCAVRQKEMSGRYLVFSVRADGLLGVFSPRELGRVQLSLMQLATGPPNYNMPIIDAYGSQVGRLSFEVEMQQVCRLRIALTGAVVTLARQALGFGVERVKHRLALVPTLSKREIGAATAYGAPDSPAHRLAAIDARRGASMRRILSVLDPAVGASAHAAAGGKAGASGERGAGGTPIPSPASSGSVASDQASSAAGGDGSSARSSGRNGPVDADAGRESGGSGGSGGSADASGAAALSPAGRARCRAAEARVPSAAPVPRPKRDSSDSASSVASVGSAASSAAAAAYGAHGAHDSHGHVLRRMHVVRPISALEAEAVPKMPEVPLPVIGLSMVPDASAANAAAAAPRQPPRRTDLTVKRLSAGGLKFKKPGAPGAQSAGPAIAAAAAAPLAKPSARDAADGMPPTSRRLVFVADVLETSESGGADGMGSLIPFPAAPHELEARAAGEEGVGGPGGGGLFSLSSTGALLANPSAASRKPSFTTSAPNASYAFIEVHVLARSFASESLHLEVLRLSKPVVAATAAAAKAVDGGADASGGSGASGASAAHAPSARPQSHRQSQPATNLVEPVGDCWVPLSKIYTPRLGRSNCATTSNETFEEVLWRDGQRVGTASGTVRIRDGPQVLQRPFGYFTEYGFTMSSPIVPLIKSPEPASRALERVRERSPSAGTDAACSDDDDELESIGYASGANPYPPGLERDATSFEEVGEVTSRSAGSRAFRLLGAPPKGVVVPNELSQITTLVAQVVNLSQSMRTGMLHADSVPGTPRSTSDCACDSLGSMRDVAESPKGNLRRARHNSDTSLIRGVTASGSLPDLSAPLLEASSESGPRLAQTLPGSRSDKIVRRFAESSVDSPAVGSVLLTKRRMGHAVARLTALMRASHKDSRCAFFYGSEAALHYAQKVFVKAWAALLGLVSSSPFDDSNAACFECLYACMARGEIDANSSLLLPARDKSRYRHVLFETLAFALEQLNSKAATPELTAFCARTLSVAFFRLPEIRDALLQAVLPDEENLRKHIREWCLEWSLHTRALRTVKKRPRTLDSLTPSPPPPSQRLAHGGLVHASTQLEIVAPPDLARTNSDRVSPSHRTSAPGAIEAQAAALTAARLARGELYRDGGAGAPPVARASSTASRGSVGSRRNSMPSAEPPRLEEGAEASAAADEGGADGDGALVSPGGGRRHSWNDSSSSAAQAAASAAGAHAAELQQQQQQQQQQLHACADAADEAGSYPLETLRACEPGGNVVNVAMADATDAQAVGMGFGVTDPLWTLVWDRLQQAEDGAATHARRAHEKHLLTRAGDVWLDRLRNRGHLFFTFFLHWTEHVSKYAPGGMLRAGFMWQAVNGYAQLIKALLLEAKRRPSERWPESLGQCVSTQIVHNPALLQVFTLVVFSRAGSHRAMSVHGALKHLGTWLTALHAAQQPLPPNFILVKLIERLVRFLLSDHFKVQAWTFIFLHNHLEILGPDARRQLLRTLAPHARALAAHWSAVVRSMYLHFVVFRVLHESEVPHDEEKWSSAAAFRSALNDLPAADAKPPRRYGEAPTARAPAGGAFHYGRAARRQWNEIEAKYREWTYQREDPRNHRLVIDVLLDGGDGDIDAVMADDW